MQHPRKAAVVSAVLDRPGVLAHGRAELDLTLREMARHAPAAAGCCACGRAWPCRERRKLAVYAEHWMLRLSLLEDTEPLTVIHRDSGRRMGPGR